MPAPIPYLTPHPRFWRLTGSNFEGLYPRTLYPTPQAVAAHLAAPVALIERVKTPSTNPTHPKHCHLRCGCLIQYRYAVTDPDGRIIDACEGYRSLPQAVHAATSRSQDHTRSVI